jgi:hypothetical protein
MRAESIVMMIAIGLVLGEQVNRMFNSGAYWMRTSDRKKWMKGPSRSGAAYGAGTRDRDDSYFEKLATEYEIIPLMSKLI